MPSVQRRSPTGTSSNTFSLQGESSAHLCVDDDIGSPDDNSTRLNLSTPTGTATADLTFAQFDLPTDCKVTSVNVSARYTNFDEVGTGMSIVIGFRLGGIFYTQSNGNSGADWLDVTKSWTTSPATNAPWTREEVNSIDRLRLNMTRGGSNTSVACTMICISVIFEGGKSRSIKFGHFV